MAEAIEESHREIPLSLQTGLQIKFHVLLECNEWKISTLEHGSLQFITKTQKIINDDGSDFKHPLSRVIWAMVVKYTKLGDGSMITLLVPFNDKTEEFDWETSNSTEKNANLWVRVFEVGSACIAKEAVIKANIDRAGKRYAYWKTVQKAARSEPMVLESCSSSWKEAVDSVDKEVLEAKENFADVHIAWMKSTKIE